MYVYMSISVHDMYLLERNCRSFINTDKEKSRYLSWKLESENLSVIENIPKNRSA